MENFDKKIKDKLASYQHNEAPTDLSVSRMMGKLDQALPQVSDTEPLDVKHRSFYSGYLFRIAASVVLLLVTGYLFYQVNEVNVIVGQRAHQSVELPDHSQVTINAGSELTYNKIGWLFNRQVSLSGEAFFEVTKGEKFVVVSRQGSTEVLGTSFNIYARRKKYSVSCRTGKVRVTSHDSSEEVTLTPGQGVTIEEGQQIGFTFNLQKQDDWRSGEFYFENIPFAIVIGELERQFGVQVSYPEALAHNVYNGYFNNRDFDQALRLVCEPMELNYRVESNKITLSPESIELN